MVLIIVLTSPFVVLCSAVVVKTHVATRLPKKVRAVIDEHDQKMMERVFGRMG